ncbi:M20 family metallopeptidase [Finegoldia magna]|uniref:M20 metallopeptidase family protein n=1 Tax=Finegoldia magna TaxID=1260 RepID=UPI0029133467|nr:M20 family metallopeptidase [Finegoldia magna]MDU7164587.1 M20 family metallopeptidase [Finegoldia magna]
MDIIEKVKKYEDFLIEERRILHQIPEIGLDTYQTCEEIEKVLIKNKIQYKKVLGSRGIIAIIDSGKPGKCLAIRADMDALEIKEDTDLSFKSKNGYMHACGHDCHMANALSTLLILNSIKDKFSGIVKFIFQPGEEYPGGAELMIKEGALENPKVDCIIGHHVGGLFSSVPHGSIGFKSGNLMASMDKFLIQIEGSGGHGSMPEDTIDPIVCLVDIVQAINRIKSREISSSEKCVISVCKVNAGINQNIIPSTAEIEGTVRTFNDEVRGYIKKRIGEIAENYATANRCKVKYDYAWKYPHLSNNEKIVELLKKSTKKIFSEDIIYDIKSETMAGDDMAYYLEKVPGAYFMLSNLKMDKNGKTYPNHHAKFDIDEGELYKAVAVCVQFALDYLN